MADGDTELMATIVYNLREKYYRHAINATLDGQKKYGNDPVLKLLGSLAMVFEDRLQESMRELEILKDRHDINIAALLVLVQAHKKCRNVDNEVVQEYEKLMREQRKQAGDRGLYYAGLTMFLLERYDKSREYVDRLLKISPQSKDGLNLRGWLEMFLVKDAAVKKAVKYFDDANELDGGKNVDSLLGKAKFFEMRRNFSGALELINQAIVAHPRFIPALVEKMRVQLSGQDWDQAVDTAQRCIDLDPGSIEGYKYQLLHILCREGNYQDDAADKLGELLQTMDRHEPKNAYQFNHLGTLFARLSGRNQFVLQQVIYLQERAVSLENGNAEYVTNLGYSVLLQGRNKDAIKHFRQAISLDDSTVMALQGIIHCQLNENHLQEAATQLDFFNEVQSSLGKSPELCYLQAVLSRKKGGSVEQMLQYLDEAIQHHFLGIKGLSLGPSYYMMLNPDFLVQIVSEYFHHAPQHPAPANQVMQPILKRCHQILHPLTRAMPGLQIGLYLMAKVRFLSGDMDAAQNSLRSCLENYPAFSDGHILLAQIHLHQNNFKLAEQSLEQGLSYNFEVRDYPVYHLIRARLLNRQGNPTEAVKALQTAMSLPGVRPPGKGDGSNTSRKKPQEISTSDRLSVYLELAEAHRTLNQQHEAAKVLQDAQNDFAGTPEEVRVTISNAELSLQRGDVEMALGILRTVTPEHTYFVQARQKMADIYLNHRKDKKLYAACYRELVEKSPTTQTYLMLGDAYMSIQEPDRAIEVYDQALQLNPKDLVLSSKMGHALIRTQHYGKAISYYEQALKGGQSALRHDLGELLLKLKQYEKAEKVLSQGLENADQVSELSELIELARYHFLLARVHSRQDRQEESGADLQRARDTQTRVLKRVMVEQPDSVLAQKQFAAKICLEMAQSLENRRDFDKAKKVYREALVYNEGEDQASLRLARLYLRTGDLDSCQQQCITLLDSETEADAAAVMMADLMFRKQEYDTAIYHAKKLLERKPDHYVALSRLVDLLRRSGQLEDVPAFFTAVETANSRATMDAGYNFCKGLYEWFTGNTGVALHHFNRARRDTDWAQQATYNMVEMCLNPDNDTIGGEVFESVDGGPGTDSTLQAEKADSESSGMKTADRLLKELKIKTDDWRYKYMQNMVLISSKQKSLIEKALTSFTEMSQDDQENVAVIYGVAAAFMVLKQTPKARNQLKRLTKNTWNIQDAEELEKGWLLLADIYIQTAKYDLAQELLKKCLVHNKSCCKAYEYMGFIMEKEQMFKPAAKNYELAWKYSNKNNPAIGYKLAFNYMKAMRCVEAIDICHHVLTNYPNYPKIKKDILDKARSCLRT